MAVTIVIDQHTTDFAEWKKVFDENVGLRKSGGVIASLVYRDPTDATHVVVMNHMKDLATAKKYLKMPALIDAMFLARVVGAPQIVILEKVDEQVY